ncbi:MAG: Pycsar system effector family protein, partial [Promethearchaeota archaeon]
LVTITLGFSLLSNIFSKLETLKISNPCLYYSYLVNFIIFISFSVIGIITTMFVFKPRESKEKAERERNGFFYFRHVSSYSSSNEYFSKIKELNEEQLMEEYSRQIYQLSHIAKEKFKFLNYSIYFLIINVGLTILFLILSSIVIHLSKED